MNNFNAIGRITNKPELRYTKENKAVSKFTLAINNSKDDTSFIPITYFGKIAETINEYCEKGDLIGVQATIKNNNYKDKEGNMHYDYIFIGNRVEFLSTKGNSTKKEKTTKIEPKNSELSEDIFKEFGDKVEIEDNVAF